jgi:hypothetical protein
LAEGKIRQDGPVMLSTRRGAPPPVPSGFAGFRFPAEVIVVAVRWYLRYKLSYRDVEELLLERGGRGRCRTRSGTCRPGHGSGT